MSPDNIYETIILKDRKQILNAILSAGGYIKGATIFYSNPSENGFENCALCLDRTGRHMWIDHLSITGCHITNLDRGEDWKIYTFFTHISVTYQQILHWGQETEPILVIPRSKEARWCKIKRMVNCDYCTTFEVECEGEGCNRTPVGHKYGKDWICLFPNT